MATKSILKPDKGVSKEVWNKCNAMLTATDSYKAAQQQWGTGSAIQQGIQAATAAVQGLALQPDAGNNRRVCTVSGRNYS